MTQQTMFDVDPTLAHYVVAWATEQLSFMTDEEYGGDWWGAYNNTLDVNIWDEGDNTHITIYPVFVSDEGYSVMDGSLFCRVGTITRTPTER
jgi:hypothetical protein